MKCRFCSKQIDKILIDLGSTAISNAFVTEDVVKTRECIYPLKVLVCDNCFLVQVDEFQKKEEIFSSDYVYFSSVSDYWLAHCKKYVEAVIPRFNLNSESLVVEIASNDGYLLQYFKEKNVPALGIEPTQSTAQIAINRGIDTVVEFFDEDLATKLAPSKKADLILGNNVLAHVPNLNSFVRGLKILLKPQGVMTFEFPHLMKLIEKTEFDTIYHEHFSYFSFFFIVKLFEFHGFEIFDVEELETHGGSLRIYVKHRESKSQTVGDKVTELLERELKTGVNDIDSYNGFQEKALEVKLNFLEYLIREKKAGKKIIAFGAAAKGNTFLNYCGIRPDLISCVVDDTPSKQGKFLPQSHIPVVSRSYFDDNKPDIIIILPWNFKKEIIGKLSFAKEWGAQFVTYIPVLEIL